ncbi:MAG: alpha-mannosidase, partial [Muribaculaceae bacterium]|nr:alpha-mannosidase [Muribaculaceae bacterium]
MLNQKIVSTLLLSLFSVTVAYSQQAWFVDGYHGGVYGHYPEWQARFMVDKLTEIPDWKISLEIEPETWDSVSVNDSKNFKDLQLYYSETGRFGRIEFTNPTWSQPYCYNISGESLIRQFAYGIDKIKEYFPEATFTTYAVEEPCFTSGMPQILKGFNFQYAALRCPNTCWGGYTTAHGKDLVNWIGSDGTSMLSVPRYGVEELSTENCFATTAANLSEEFVDACYKDGIKYPVGMCYQDAGWKHGPWIGAAVKNYHKPMQFTTWTEYINKIKSSVTPTDWKFSVEDVKPGLVWGSQVLQKIAREVRVSENKLVMAEKMAALDWLLTGREWPAAGLAEAWRTLMLAQHHDCWIVPYNHTGNKGLTWAGRVTEWTDASNR